nr:hypothetical protein Itr_chr12CG25090 [Ipomoea trifida]
MAVTAVKPTPSAVASSDRIPAATTKSNTGDFQSWELAETRFQFLTQAGVSATKRLPFLIRFFILITLLVFPVTPRTRQRERRNGFQERRARLARKFSQRNC